MQQYRLGCPVRIAGRPSLQHPPHAAHFSVQLIALRDILTYLHQQHIHLYRLSPALLPAPDSPDTPPYHTAGQHLNECAPEVAHLRDLAHQFAIRLTMHLPHHLSLSTPDTAHAARSIAQIEAQALLLHHLAPDDGLLILHMAGPTSEPAATLQRFANRYQALSPLARARLAVEHDTAFSLGTLLILHQHCGIPIVFDYLHHLLHNPHRLPLRTALGLALATWPPHQRPKIHLSTHRTEAHLLPSTHDRSRHILPPRPGQHADYINPHDMLAILQAAQGAPSFDIMLEARAADLALLRLRHDIARLAPTLAPAIA